MSEEKASEEADLATRLDQYVSELRSGKTPDRKKILAEHPNAGELLDCLEGLDALAQAALEARPALPLGSLQAGPPRLWLGKYELLQPIGRGGMGIVYRARQTDLDRLVAIKMIHAGQTLSPETVLRFETEAKAAAGLRHPHILQVFEAGSIDGQHYFAMEYIEGPSLAAVARRGPMDPQAAATIMRDVARAVAYLHARGIVHRDLKPSNILLDAENRAYVADFGLVKWLESGSDLTSTGAIVGTPSYMAPEQAAGLNEMVGPLSDVYSLGAILYELLTGRPPFSEPAPLETLVQVLEGEPLLPRQVNRRVPAELEMVCLKALSKAPENRYAAAEALAADLDRFLCGEPVQARPENACQRLVRWARQESALACRLLLFAACAVIAHAYYLAFHPVRLAIHAEIMAVLAVWAVVSLICQAFLRRQTKTELVRMVWLAADGILLTIVLSLDGAYTSPLALGYGVLIVASGLWFSVRLVWYTTAIALAGYTLLVGAGVAAGAPNESPQHHVIAVVALLVVGVMVAAQVRRVRALSRYYESRPLGS